MTQSDQNAFKMRVKTRNGHKKGALGVPGRPTFAGDTPPPAREPEHVDPILTHFDPFRAPLDPFEHTLAHFEPFSSPTKPKVNQS